MLLLKAWRGFDHRWMRLTYEGGVFNGVEVR
jgi:hypothetical protein